MMINRMSLLLAGVLLIYVCGCDNQDEHPSSAQQELVVYYSIDEPFARRVLDEFEKRSGFKLQRIGDTEAGKTTGLVNKIMREARSSNPRADVFWSSEIFQTIRLARLGLLASYDSPAARDIPPRYRDAQHRWTATALRGRVLAFDPKRTEASTLPRTWRQLAEPMYASQLAIANPLFGTTRGHVAAMFTLWGAKSAHAFLERLSAGGVTVVDGNSSAVRALIAGKVRYAMTDTDDVIMAQKSGASVDMRFLDMGDGGTLLIPCTVALIKGSPHEHQAQALVDYLVSSEVERMLAQSHSRNIPVRQALRERLGISMPPTSDVSYEDVVDAMDQAVTSVRDILLR